MLLLPHTPYKNTVVLNGQPTSSDVVTEFLPELTDGLGDVEDFSTHEAIRQLHKEETIFSHHKRKVLHYHQSYRLYTDSP